MNSQPVVRLRSVVLDCPDPRALAAFYAGLLGARADTSDREWCEVHLEEPPVKLAFQRADPYQAPQWPDGVPQQLHLDLTVADLEAASAQAVSLGATVLTGPVEEHDGVFIVHADPACHPFCLFMERPMTKQARGPAAAGFRLAPDPADPEPAQGLNQQTDTSEPPVSTTPACHSSSTSSRSCTCHTASRFTRLPPATQIMSWPSRSPPTSAVLGCGYSARQGPSSSSRLSGWEPGGSRAGRSLRNGPAAGQSQAG
jgi:predicted enzyme related to lactoylglutathione lyase